jgi:1-aminocyclopropane-1-carboxylate deaminase/D-cysteine desulfhydrase-like pyridoxal-dependent ACC family enzyme
LDRVKYGSKLLSKSKLIRLNYRPDLMFTHQESLRPFPKLHNSLLPTPVHRLDYLSDEYGVNVYCKRDDLTGFGFGGNKTRKLDFLLPDALSQGCDTLIAIGANQSNFCRMAAAYGVASRMEVHLVLGGKEPEKSKRMLWLLKCQTSIY